VSDTLSRMTHAARELERFARVQLLEATEDRRIRDSRVLLRLAKGVRRKLEREQLLARPPVSPERSRRSATTRAAAAASSVAARSA